MAEGQAQPAASQRMQVIPVIPAPTLNPVQKIQAILEAERAEKAPPAQQPPAQQAAPEPEPAPEPEAQAEPEPAPEAEAPAETNQQVEGAPSEEIPLEQLEAIALEVTTKGDDGKDVVQKLPIKELRDGYMRQADYSRKTADVARQREAIPEEIRKGVEGERAAYYQTLQTLQDLVLTSMDAEIKTADWNALAKDDPATYVRLDNRRKEIDRTLSELTAKQQEVLNKRKEERAQARDEQARKSWDVLEKIPGWSATTYQKLMKSAVDDYGYKPDEVAAWVDHKAFEVLHDAVQFRQLKAQKGETPPMNTKKVVVVPKVIKPGAAAPATAVQTRQAESMKKLQKSGRIEDAAAVIKSRMG